MRRNIRKNNYNALYERIMQVVDRSVRKALNESSVTNNLPVIRTEKDVRLLKKKDFVRDYDHNCRSIKFNIDLSYIFPDGNWSNPIVPAEFSYFYTTVRSEADWSEINVDCSDDELEINGYSYEDLEEYLSDNHDIWLYDYLGLN